MEIPPIIAIVLRHIRLWTRDINLILVTLYWPLLDVLVWGFLGTWMQTSQTTGQDYESVMILGILLWQVSARSAIMIANSFLEEIMSLNLINLFSLPLRLSEWICGSITFAMIFSTINAIYCMGLIMLLYKISFFKLITTFALFAPPLFLTGIFLGFVGLQMLVFVGKRAAELVFIVAWFAAPFSGAFYPRDVLPAWGKIISYALPMSYVFEALRAYLLFGIDPTHNLVKGYVLGGLYALLAIAGFVCMFHLSKKKGLARLSD